MEIVIFVNVLSVIPIIAGIIMISFSFIELISMFIYRKDKEMFLSIKNKCELSFIMGTAWFIFYTIIGFIIRMSHESTILMDEEISTSNFSIIGFCILFLVYVIFTNFTNFIFITFSKFLFIYNDINNNIIDIIDIIFPINNNGA